MEIALLLVLAVSCIAVIGSVLMQDSNDSGLGTLAGQEEKLFGKAKATGRQASLKRITVISSAVMVVTILLYNIIS